MLKRFLILLTAAALVAVTVACSGGDNTKDTVKAAGNDTQPATYAHPELLAETGWLKDQLNDKNLVVVDLRKKDAYAAQHIPGAVWYDAGKLKDAADKLHVITDDEFARLAGDIGIDNTKTVVAYDDSAGLSAARFWWVLWYYGNDHGKVLNGGWPKWEKESLPTSKDTPTVEKAVFKPVVNDSVICALDYVEQKSAKKDDNLVILDVRSPAEYSGADVRAAKGGHVPNSVNLDWTRSMTDSDPKVWKSAGELAKQFEQVGVKKGMQVITYCQTGVRAAHSLFTLRLMGYDRVKNYDGSWQEWGNSKDTPTGQ